MPSHNYHIFIQLSIFILKFVKLTEDLVIILKITLSFHHQLEKAGAFLPDSKYHAKQANHILKLKAFLEPSSLYARKFLGFFCLLVPKTE